MTELTIRPDEIRGALERFVSSYQPDEADKAEVGRVIDTGDGIARVEGLHSTMTNELLDFGDGVLGIALNLDVREIGCVILGDAQHIREGQEVRRTGEILSVPVGDGFLGRVVDPLSKPIDGLGDIDGIDGESGKAVSTNENSCAAIEADEELIANVLAAPTRWHEHGGMLLVRSNPKDAWIELRR